MIQVEKRPRSSKRRKNLSKFQCHKFLHRRTNTRKTEEEEGNTSAAPQLYH